MNLGLRSLASVLIFSALAACGAPSDGLAPTSDPGGAGKSDSPASAVLRFSVQGEPTLSQALVAGQTARIVYEIDRLSGCRSDAWAMTAHVRAAGQDVPQELALTRLEGGAVVPVDALFIVPNASSLSLWFTVHDRHGCLAYDSDGGKDYHFAVTTRPEVTLHFDADWSETIDGTLQSNAVVKLDYDLARLPHCPSSTPFARYRLDGGAVNVAQLSAADGGERATAALVLPAGVSSLELWFERVSRYGCNETDSDFGHNYQFSVE